MNNRIKELAEKCNKQAKEIYKGDWPYNCAAWTGEELINFANLIILESTVYLEESGHPELAEKLGDHWNEEQQKDQ
jgi:hypothetical protein